MTSADIVQIKRMNQPNTLSGSGGGGSPSGLTGIEGGGDGPYDGYMEARVTRLETTIEFVRRDLDEIKADNKEILRLLPKLASKSSVWGALATGGGIAVAVVALFVGVLTYLQALPHP